MLQPKKQKFRKQFRGRMTGISIRGGKVEFGDYGVQALEPIWLTARQIEAARKAIANFTKRKGKYWVRVFPDKPVTKKPAEVRMGKGKGPVDHFACVLRPGRIVFEIGGLPKDVAIGALERAARKLPVTTRIISKEDLI